MRKGCLFVLIGAVLLEGVASAGADSPPTITITKTGPDGEIPVGKTFYVAGTAGPEASRVQPIVLRKGSDRVFSGNGAGCSTLLGTMGKLNSTKPNDLPELSTGIRQASTIWEHGGDGKALVLPRWDRDKLTGDQSFKILVPGDKSFFRPGFTYCLFVYERTSKSKSVEAEVRAELRTYSDACKDKARCTAARNVLEAKLTALAVSDDVVALVNELTNASEKLQFSPLAITTVLTSWGEAFAPGSKLPTFVRRVQLPLFLELEPPAKKKPKDPDPNPAAETNASIVALAAAVASTLARSDGLHMDGVHYARMDGTRIRYLGFRAGGVIDLSIDAAAGNTKSLTLKADAVMLPNTTVSLRDMLEFSQGRLQFTTEYETLDTILSRLKPILLDPLAATPEDIQILETFGTRIDALATAMRRAFTASTGYQCATKDKAAGFTAGAPDLALTRSELIERNLGQWLRCEVVLDACDALAKEWATKVDGTPPSCGTSQDAWPGYADAEVTPLTKLSASIGDLVRAQKKWKAKSAALVSTEITTVERARALDVKISFTQETWIGSYLTPVVGYARLSKIDSTLFYVGVQLHLYPNEIDEPQWTNGFKHDIRRSAAIEFGFAPKADTFGPDGRFDGWSFLPPLFVGVSLHPLPYASVTFGAAIVDRRETTIAQELRRRDTMFFVGLNLQANAPDLIYKSLDYGLATKAEN